MTDSDNNTADTPEQDSIDMPETEKPETSQDVDPVAALQDELAAARQDVLYAQAETQNVRRRLEKELQDARAYAATAFARDILSVGDNLTRALAVIPAAMREDEAMKALIAGLDATVKDMENVLRKNGIEKFETLGEALDPNRHQAMIEIPHADAEPGTVVQELQAGYMIRDRLLRPALVGVAKTPD